MGCAFRPFQAAKRLEETPTICPAPFNVALQCIVGLGSRSECCPVPQRGFLGATCSRESPLSTMSATQKPEHAFFAGRDGGAASPALLRSGWHTLGDGRLGVGTHMPLLAQRYRYLSLLGEGTSAQVPHPLTAHAMDVCGRISMPGRISTHGC